MEKNDLINKLKSKNVYQIKKEEDFNFISEIKPSNEVETHFVGKIELFELNDELIVKERDDKGSIYYRLVDSEKGYNDFVKDRLDIYDRMWDGCGCKVNYCEEWEGRQNAKS